MSLKDELMEIRGIGDAKADAILEVLAESDEYGQSVDVQEIIDCIEAEQYGTALKYLRE